MQRVSKMKNKEKKPLTWIQV